MSVCRKRRSKELIFAKQNIAYVCCRKINFANRISIVFDTELHGMGENTRRSRSIRKAKGPKHSSLRSEIWRMCVVSKLIPYHVSFEVLTLIAWDGANMKFVRVFIKRQRSEALVFVKRDIAYVCGPQDSFRNPFLLYF